MNRTILSIICVATAMSLAACDARFRPRKKPAPGPNPEPTVMIPDEPTPDELAREGKKRDEVVDPSAAKGNKIPPPPTPNTPEYAIKVEGKAGYVKSPYDTQGRLIDVRGLPPGTEAECPYTRRTFLVPP